MDATTSAAALAAAVTEALRVVPPRSDATILAYTGVLLRARPDRVEVVASDGRVTIGVEVPATVHVVGQALAPARALASWLADAGDRNVDLARSVDGLTLTVASGPTATFNPPAVNFPDLTDSEATAAPISGYGLRRATAAVLTSVGADQVVQITSTTSDLQLAATDNHRLTVVHVPGAGFGPFEGLVPARGLALLEHHPADHVIADPERGTIRFHGPRSLVELPLEDRPFPAGVRDVADQDCDLTATVGRATFAAAVARLAAFAGSPGDLIPVRGRLDTTTLTLKVDNPRIGSSVETIPATVTGLDAASPAVPFAVAHTFLTDAADAHAADEVTIGLHTDMRPVVIRSRGALTTSVVLSQMLL